MGKVMLGLNPDILSSHSNNPKTPFPISRCCNRNSGLLSLDSSYQWQQGHMVHAQAYTKGLNVCCLDKFTLQLRQDRSMLCVS